MHTEPRSTLPVDHHAAAAVTRVPFGHEVLIECAEMLAVRRASRGALTPNTGVTNRERRVDHAPRRLSQCVGVDIAPPGVQQFFVAVPVPAGRETLEPSIRA